MEDNFLVKQQVKRGRKKEGKPLHSLAVSKDRLKRGPVEKATLELGIMEVKPLQGLVLEKTL